MNGPEYITIRLSEAEDNHLTLLLALASIKNLKKVTTKGYMAHILKLALKDNLQLPYESSLPPLAKNDVKNRIALVMTDDMYKDIEMIRKNHLESSKNDGELEYGNPDIFRQIIGILYEDVAIRIRNQFQSDDLVEPVAEHMIPSVDISNFNNNDQVLYTDLMRQRP